MYYSGELLQGHMGPDTKGFNMKLKMLSTQSHFAYFYLYETTMNKKLGMTGT